VEYPDDDSCFDDHGVQDESQAELFLDIVGDNEPVKMEESKISEASNPTRYTIIENKPISHCPTIRGQNDNNNEIKCEEFDVDEFLSNETNDFACPSSPDSEPVSPSDSTIVEIDSSFQMHNATAESSVVGKPADDGYGMIQGGSFIDDEFLLSSCATNDELNDECNITDVDDPFSELFPTLLSV